MSELLPDNSSQRLEFSRTRTVWSESEDAILKLCFQRGLSPLAIAKRHRRTFGSILGRLSEIGAFDKVSSDLLYFLSDEERIWLLHEVRHKDIVDPTPEDRRATMLLHSFVQPQTTAEAHWAQYLAGAEATEYGEAGYAILLFLDIADAESENERQILAVIQEKALPATAEQTLAYARTLGYRDAEFWNIPLKEWWEKRKAWDNYNRVCQENEAEAHQGEYIYDDDEWIESLREMYAGGPEYIDLDNVMCQWDSHDLDR